VKNRWFGDAADSLTAASDSYRRGVSVSGTACVAARARRPRPPPGLRSTGCGAAGSAGRAPAPFWIRDSRQVSWGGVHHRSAHRFCCITWEISGPFVLGTSFAALGTWERAVEAPTTLPCARGGGGHRAAATHVWWRSCTIPVGAAARLGHQGRSGCTHLDYGRAAARSARTAEKGGGA